MLMEMLFALLNGLWCAAAFAIYAAACLVVHVGIPLAFLLFLVVSYHSLTKGRCVSKRRMDGKTVIITGANSGIGLCAAKDLAMRGARVILACRNPERAEAAKREIIRDTEAPEENVITKNLDLASLKSVRAFAEDILETVSRLDILINNAGLLYIGSRKNTEDGLEYTMACNHYGHFLLTNLLLDLLKKSTPSRIINVSSFGHVGGDISTQRLQDPHAEGWSLYADSKLANIVFTQELAKRLPRGVTTNSLHPGAVGTNILSNASAFDGSMFASVSKILTNPALGIYKYPEEGAQTVIHLAVSKDVEEVTGKYFSECKPTIVLNRQAYDLDVGRKLWEISEKLTGLSGKRD